MKILKNYSLKELNTFRVDINAKFFVEIHTAEEIEQLLSENKFSNQKKLILGGGSNVLFTHNYEGLIIKNSIPGVKIVDENSSEVVIESGAGVEWNKLVEFCIGKNYGGIENLVLIPGSVGAAPIQNIGAYGQELCGTFNSLNGYYLDTGENKMFTTSDCNFSYRNSVFKEELVNKFIITSIQLRLSKTPQVNLSYEPVKREIDEKGISDPSIKDVSEIITKIRRSKLPDPKKLGNAGSFFRNPVISIEKFNLMQKSYPDIVHYPIDKEFVKIAAGWLIEKCGWKGKRVGNAGTYSKQALVITNFGNATGDEILEIATRIREAVELKFGIILQNEVNVIN